jgi:hypothetical protein
VVSAEVWDAAGAFRTFLKNPEKLALSEFFRQPFNTFFWWGGIHIY